MRPLRSRLTRPRAEAPPPTRRPSDTAVWHLAPNLLEASSVSGACMAGAFGAGLIGTLAVIMVVSAVAVVVFRRLQQPAVLGYLLAGMAVGPGSNLLPTGITPDEISQFADLGVIFLLLFIGMEFDLRQLRSIGAPAVLIGTFEVAAVIGVGVALGLR